MERVSKATKIKVSSVAEYMTAIKEHKLQDDFSRGEYIAYPLICSSKAYRKDLYYEKAITDFEKIVFKDLSDLQQKHFLAFCQHYGLPTNLVDFTKSPLVSLFFACHAENINKEHGYVYFIHDKMDITDLIIKDNFLDINKLFDIVAEDKTRYWSTHASKDLLIALLQQNIEKLQKAKFTVSMIDRINSNDKSPLFDLAKYYRTNEIDCSWNGKIAEYIFEKGLSFSDNNNFYFLCYLMLLQVFKPATFDLPTHFTYNPPEIIDRMSVQHSIFVYQFRNDYGRSFQQLNPSFTIEIDGNQKGEIKNDLDCLGFNIKTIFGDYDNIAKYILSKTYERI